MSDFSTAFHTRFNPRGDSKGVQHVRFILLIIALLILSTVSGYVVVTGVAGLGIWDDVIFVASFGLLLVLILIKISERITLSIHEHEASEQNQQRS